MPWLSVPPWVQSSENRDRVTYGLDKDDILFALNLLAMFQSETSTDLIVRLPIGTSSCIRLT